MKNLEIGDTVDKCIYKLEFVEHFFSFVPQMDTDIPKRVTTGLCFILEEIITNLKHVSGDGNQEEEMNGEKKEAV